MSDKKTVEVTTHYDGGGGNKTAEQVVTTRTNADGSKEALVQTGGDGGGKNTEWVPLK